MTKKINTVTGPISQEELGITLCHEHFFIGQPGWDGDRTIAPFSSEKLVSMGTDLVSGLAPYNIGTIVDATANDFGRQPEIYKKIAEQTGVNIICSTGFFNESEGASGYWKFRELLGNAEKELYEVMKTEITVGIHGTDIKAGVIKIATGKDIISDYEKMIFRAAAKAQTETGVPIITHTQDGTMAPEQAEFLISEGVDPSKILISHMSSNLDIAYQEKTLEYGVSAGWDRLGLFGLANVPTDEEKNQVIAELINKGWIEKIFLSHDYIMKWLGREAEPPEIVKPMLENWYPDHIFLRTIPALRKLDISDEQIDTILRKNPMRLFS